jgi:hypothetical protein
MTVLKAVSQDCYVQQLVIDNIFYNLTLTWNSRGNFWFMDITDQNDDPIQNGIPLVIGYNMFAPYPDVGLPTSGQMLCIDTTDTGIPIGHDDIVNGRIILGYFILP